MADTDDDRYNDVDIDSILSRVERRPLTFSKKRSLCQAPEFLKRLYGEDTLAEGEALRIQCQVVGFPKPSLRWFKDDEEITQNERYTIEALEDNCYALSIPLVSKCDEASYKCKAENVEGSASSLLFVHIKGKSGSKSPKKGKSQSPSRRTVSFPPLVPTIVERVVEEEKAEAELEKLPPSPLTALYDSLTQPQKHARPTFLGDWAFVKNNAPNNHTDGLLIDSEDDDMVFLPTSREGDHPDSSPSDDSKSESGSPDEKKPEEVDIGNTAQATLSATSGKVPAQNMAASQKTDESPVDINENSKRKLPSEDEPHSRKHVPLNQKKVALHAPPSAPPHAVDTPSSSSRPLFTRKRKPKKLIVRKRQTTSPSDLCNSFDFGVLFLLVTFFTFASLCVDLNPGRFLSMICTAYVIYAFIMALIYGEPQERQRDNSATSEETLAS